MKMRIFYLNYPLSNVIMNLKLSCVIKQYALNIIIQCIYV
jgi:hypothetical protein